MQRLKAISVFHQLSDETFEVVLWFWAHEVAVNGCGREREREREREILAIEKTYLILVSKALLFRYMLAIYSKFSSPLNWKKTLQEALEYLENQHLWCRRLPPVTAWSTPSITTGRTQSHRAMLCPYLKTNKIELSFNKPLEKKPPPFWSYILIYTYILIYKYI